MQTLNAVALNTHSTTTQGLLADSAQRSSDGAIRLSEVVSALSRALDITEGQPVGHAVRSCLIGMRIADELGLSEQDRSALYYALQLKDLGCSNNSAKIAQLMGTDDRQFKRCVKTVDTCRLLPKFMFVWRNVLSGGSMAARILRLIAVGLTSEKKAREFIQLRCERGAEIARSFGLPEETSAAIRTLDEHWNGKGYPDGLKQDQIPLLGRILCLAQTVEVFVTHHDVETALTMARERSGTWFDPMLVRALHATRNDSEFWSQLVSGDVEQLIAESEPADLIIHADQPRLDRIAEGFARVVDAKSPWTYHHSQGVAELAVGIARVMGLDDLQVNDIRRAALLHDIGKLGVSNMILDKPGRLTEEEFTSLKQHARYSYEILSCVSGFSHLAKMAAAHHERLDGNGYYLGLTAAHLDTPMRILAVADVFEAMSADRPYRETMPLESIFSILDKDQGSHLCPNAYTALRTILDRGQCGLRRLSDSTPHLNSIRP